MKAFKYLLFLLTFSMFAQQSIEVNFVKQIKLNVETLVGVDNFETTYYTINNIFHKKIKDKIITYSNIQLGQITTANSFNPLKINLFYRAFNTVVILDNRLSEMFRIDFNSIQPFKDVTHVSAGNDNTIWLFNQNMQQLENYDYKTNTTRVQTLPIQGEILDLKSNYNFCWLLTKDYILTYNYVGSLLSKIKNTGFTNLVEMNGNLILQKENQLFYLNKDTKIFTELKTQKLLIKQFLVTNQTLYIYDDEYLHQYQIKTN
ncbi:MAG: hypothetical protein L3J25_01345 [Flavobacteriaceae bacterium]|nr:hypothetical protein [Flavobacteriaceae bacterium]